MAFNAITRPYVLLLVLLFVLRLTFIKYGGSSLVDNSDQDAVATTPPPNINMPNTETSVRGVTGSDALGRLRQALLAERPRERPRLVACAQLRNMLNAAQVWAAFHLLQGFDRIVLYDDGSEPPLTPADFGGLAAFIDVKRGYYDVSGSPNKIGRQWQAYRDCLNSESGNNTYVALFDVDEFFWSCNGSKHFADVAGGYDTIELQMSRCPRFASTSKYDPSLPIFSQLLFRAPAMHDEPIFQVKTSIPDCTLLKSQNEARGVCFGSTAPKSIFNMRKYTKETEKYLTIHGLMNKPGHPPAPNHTVATVSRSSGLCCNHYFLRDDAEAARKAADNRNDFYKLYTASEGIRSFYRWKVDTLLLDQFTRPVVELLQAAGLPFQLP